MASGRLIGKTCVVSGAARGIGKEIAVRFVEEGAQVGVVDLDLKGAQKVAAEININSEGGKALACQCDVSSRDDVKRMIKSCLLYTSPSPRD